VSVRSIPARAVDYTAKSGVVCHCRSATEEHFLRYLDRFYPAQQWAYEPVTLRDPAGGYKPDVRVLTDPVVWFEVKYAGFLDSWHDELADAMRKLEVLRRHRPHDRIALMPWGFDWTEPMGPFLLNTKRGWNLVKPGEVAVPWQVPA
jgi:hypothetical protein